MISIDNKTLRVYPSLYQINTRVWLRTLSTKLGRPVLLDDVPDNEIDHIAGCGFDWVWLLGVWSTGQAGQKIALTDPQLRVRYQEALPDFSEEDVCGSPFAITGYDVNPEFGGENALERFRQKLQPRGIRLMLDFIPNHTARDHPWVQEHPDFYVSGSTEDLAREPGNYGVAPGEDTQILAFGRDPYFPGWSDTFQLNYGNLDLQAAMRGELGKIANLCDGVRCDMAMLILPQVFRRTWGIESAPFWPDAIRSVRASHPAFTFLAEVYWELEWEIQAQGFDFAYDKRLYDRLIFGESRSVRDHFLAGPDYQAKLARFLENHDEPRAAATFPPGMHQAAAAVTYFSPGLRFYHQGQLEGYRVRLPVQLCRSLDETPDPQIEAFYAQLLEVLKRRVLREGDWQQLEPKPAWTVNSSNDCFIVFAWQGEASGQLVVVVNYCPNQSQCYIRLPFAELEGLTVSLTDLMNGTNYVRDGSDLLGRGLYLDLPPWGYHVFEVTASEQ